MNKKWSINEENYIRDNAGRLTDTEIASKLTKITGRKITMTAVRKKRQKLGLKKAQGRGYCRLKDDKIYNVN